MLAKIAEPTWRGANLATPRCEPFSRMERVIFEIIAWTHYEDEDVGNAPYVTDTIGKVWGNPGARKGVLYRPREREVTGAAATAASRGSRCA